MSTFCVICNVNKVLSQIFFCHKLYYSQGRIRYSINPGIFWVDDLYKISGFQTNLRQKYLGQDLISGLIKTLIKALNWYII